MTSHKDQKYLLALREGDTSLIQELYAKHTPQVVRWVVKNNGTISDAEDVFQEAIVAMYNKALDKDFVLSYPIGGLLFQICKNKWIDQIRRKNKEHVVRSAEQKRYEEKGEYIPALEKVEEEEIRQDKLDKSFQQLSDLCQKLLKLLSKGNSPTEVAIQLSMNNANTVYRRKSACADRWRKIYSDLTW